MQAMPLDEGKTVNFTVLLFHRPVPIDLDDVERVAGQILSGIPSGLVPVTQVFRDVDRHVVGRLAGRHARLAADAKRRIVKHADGLRRHLLRRPRNGRRFGWHGRLRCGEAGTHQEIPAVDVGHG